MNHEHDTGYVWGYTHVYVGAEFDCLWDSTGRLERRWEAGEGDFRQRQGEEVDDGPERRGRHSSRHGHDCGTGQC